MHREEACRYCCYLIQLKLWYLAEHAQCDDTKLNPNMLLQHGTNSGTHRGGLDTFQQSPTMGMLVSCYFITAF